MACKCLCGMTTKMLTKKYSILHGGAYVLQPSMMHFNMVHKIAQAIDAKVVFPIYPKAPKHQYRETYEKLEKVYRGLLEEHTNRILLL